MLTVLSAIMTLSVATLAPAAANTTAGPTDLAPLDVPGPPRPAAKSHRQRVIERWSPRVVTCRGVFVQGLGIVRRECAANRDWELAAQRERHTLMQAQWHWVSW